MAAKYKAYVDNMFVENKEIFASFQKVHDNFSLDRKKWRKKFDEQGAEVVEIMRSWEHRLCSGMEKGKYATYSIQLSEKFWQEIKKHFKLIDLVGIESNLG